jgi:nucleotide-binding universal stress UspA family protein
VHGHNVPEDWTPRRILVPTNGSLASRRAAEIAFTLVAGVREGLSVPVKVAAVSEDGMGANTESAENAADDDYSVVILRVVEENRSSYRLDVGGMQIARHLNVAHRTVEQLRQLGEMQGIAALGEVRVGDEPETTILNIARADDIDLIVLGTNIHAGSDRLYLGPRVERILNNAPCPVIIVNS